MTLPVSAPSWARSSSDLWLAALEPMVGLKQSDRVYQALLYPHDTPADQRQLAMSQSGCALTWLAAARAVRIEDGGAELAEPYAERNGLAVSDVESICRRHGALERVGADVALCTADVVRIGNDDLASGGYAHILTVRWVDGDTVESIDGGQWASKDDEEGRWKAGAAITIVRRTIERSNGRVWLVDSKGRAKRVETVGRCERLRLGDSGGDSGG